MFCLCSWVLSHTMRWEETFLRCEDAHLFLHSAPGEMSHLSPQNIMSAFCPHRGARRIGWSQWEPTLLFWLCRVEKGISVPMIQGSVWPLPVWGWGPCSPQTACSKVRAEGGGKVVGWRSWRSLCCAGAEACCPCVCCCLTTAVALAARSGFPAAPLKPRRTWASKG